MPIHDRTAQGISRLDAVQPSLWDRMIDDLPGLQSDNKAARAALATRLGTVRVSELLEGGERAFLEDETLDMSDRKALYHLAANLEREAKLAAQMVTVTPDVLREAVRRDMEALFSVERFETWLAHENRIVGAKDGCEETSDADLQEIISLFPEARRSVINYGIPSFSGRRFGDFNTEKLSEELVALIETFEPRLEKGSVRVTIRPGDDIGMRIIVEGKLLLSPVPEQLRLTTLVDLDSGQATTDNEAS